jgi:hypothetical protein
MLENISHVIWLLIKKGIINIKSDVYTNPDKYHFSRHRCLINLDSEYANDCEYEITEEFILKHIGLFVIGIKEIEFFFDFHPKNITVNLDDVLTFNTSNSTFHRYFSEYKRKKQSQKAVVICDSTLYSSDYIPYSRHSTLIYYDRTKSLLRQNQIKHSVINAFPYRNRIEFRLTRKGSQYLAIENINGNYDEIIHRFIPLLGIQYYKYFYDVIYVNSNEHPYFTAIYEKAKEERKRYTQKDLLKYKVDGSLRYSFIYLEYIYKQLLCLLDEDDTIIKHKQTINSNEINIADNTL